MPRNLLFELGTEEIPASYISPALAQLAEAVENELAGARLSHGSVRTLATPRRLTVIVSDVADSQERETKTVKGPPARVAFAEDGTPTKAAEGFARKAGVNVADLAVVGDYVEVEVTDEGGPSSDVLPGCLAAAVSTLSFPKTMRWGPDVRFARPIRWVVALLGGDVLEFEYAGVKAGRATRGLRSWSKGDHEVADASVYEDLLRDSYVIVDHEKRRSMIESETERAARACGGSVVADPDLLDEVTFLVEYPTVYVGNFDARFLELPRDVIVAAMKGHQRYFAVEKKDGTLLPHFLCVVNAPQDYHDVIREGNERVLESRLDDAAFYWEEDTRTSLDAKVDALKDVVWLEGVGSLYEKSQRMETLASYVAKVVAPNEADTAVRAARLAKADLVTEMVRDGKEFTELQGIMGREYALHSNEPQSVATAIHEHYMPRFAGDALPSSEAGTILSIADKVDSIVGCFSVGLVPTGSADPYALRRQAIGVLRMIDENELPLSLRALAREAAKGYGVDGEALGELEDSVLDFVRQRARIFFMESGHAYDLVDAVLESSFDSLTGVRPRLKALTHFRAEDDFAGLVIGARRASNILKDVTSRELDASALVEPASKALHDAATGAAGKVESAISAGDFDSAVRELLTLRTPIDTFFDDVMVMVDDEKLKTARLGLLSEVRNLFLQVADFSKVVLEGEEREE